MNWLNHHLPAPLVSGDWFSGRFLLRLSRIKRPKVMSMVKFSPIALNFGHDFVLLVHFLGHPVCIHKHKNVNTPRYIQISVPPNWNKAQLRKMLQFARNFAHLCEMLLKYEQYFVQSSNISCNWARSFSGLTSVNKPTFLGYWNPKNVSKLVFLLRHLHKNCH